MGNTLTRLSPSPRRSLDALNDFFFMKTDITFDLNQGKILSECSTGLIP
jgi:hypothetical protein